MLYCFRHRLAVSLILCIVASGVTMGSVFQSGFLFREMAVGEDGRISRSVLGLVAEASRSRFVCVTIPSELHNISLSIMCSFFLTLIHVCVRYFFANIAESNLLLIY